METSTPNGTETTGSGVIKMEKTLFLAVISVIAVLAVPPNLILLNLARGGRKKGPSQPAERSAGSLPLLLISQSVSHLLLSLTSPLDVLFLVQATNDYDAECVLFLSVKSVLILFSVLAVSLQGLDKVYRVKHIQRPFFHTRSRAIHSAIAAALLISAIPLALQVALTDGRSLRDGRCEVEPAVVDVTEGIFFASCLVSMTSFVVVTCLLRRHGRRVGIRMTSASKMTSFFPASSRQGQLVSEPVAVESLNNPSELEVPQMSQPLTKKNDLQRQPSIPSIVAVGGQKNSFSINMASTGLLAPARLRLPPLPPDPTPTISSFHNNHDPPTFFPAVISENCRNELTELNLNAEPSIKIISAFPKCHKPLSRGPPLASWESPCSGSVRSRELRMGETRFSANCDSLSLRANHDRQKSSQAITRSRLQTATLASAKRGMLTMGVFLACYLPLMVTLFVLCFNHPEYETALLMEGLTLPIIYVHAFLSPLLVIRLDRQWRQHTVVWWRRLQCWKKDRASAR